MSNRSPIDHELSTDERHIIEVIDAQFAPQAMTASARVAFRQRLDEQLERRNQFPWRLTLASAATAVAVFVMWNAVGRTAVPASSQVAVQPQEDSFVMYAYVDPDLDEDSLSTGNSLPEDYRVLAVAADLPVNGALYAE
ncbi:MAG TPA: hypothetical protein VMT89_16560 [Candidatus Acidoferrales bacterium]|nr:hypothetical protein [Candidatus Acidoferrales bacterium]